MLFSVATGPEDVVPHLQDLDQKTRDAIIAWWPCVNAKVEAMRATAKALAGVRVVEYPHGHHYLFIPQRAAVLDEIRSSRAECKLRIVRG
jgi:hypothetical protein